MSPLAMDSLPASARTPLLIRGQLVPTDPHAVLDRAGERRQLLGRVDVYVPSGAPATRRRLDIDQRQLIGVDATTCHESGHVARRPSPAGAPWVACDPTTPRLRPRRQGCVANRPLFVRSPSQSCAGVLPAQDTFSCSFARFLPSGGGGNRTRVRGRTEQSVYERSPCLISPAGRFTDNLPTGQPS